MKILIIGGSGYIGAVTAHIASEHQHEVTILDNNSSGLDDNVPKGAQFIKADITDQAAIEKVFSDASYDVVMHFAARILVPESMKRPYDYIYTNSFGVLNVVEAATKSGVKNYILSSSAAVYGAPKEFPITEDSLKKPVNPYGESKLIAEHILSSYEQALNLNWAAFRYFNVAGAYAGVGPDYPFVSHVIPALFDAAYKNKPFTINGNDYATDDGTCVRDFVHVADIGRAHVIAAEKMLNGETLSQPLNLGSSSGYSVKQITDQFIASTGKQLDVSYAPRRPGDPDKLVASNERAHAILGWEPELGLEAIITDQAKWYEALPPTARVKNIA